MPERGPTVRPVGLRRLAAAVALGAAVTWVGVQALLWCGSTVPALAVSAWLPLLAIAGFVGWLAWRTRADLQAERPLDAEVLPRRLRAGQAAMLLGGAFLGAGPVLAAYGIAGWPAPLAQGRVLHGAAMALTALACAAAGRAVERACTVRPPDDTDSGRDPS